MFAQSFDRAIRRATAAGLLLVLFGATAGAQDEVLSINATWSFLRGTEEPPLDWFSPGFDDSSWEVGQAPFGYEAGGGPPQPADLVTILGDMQGGYLSFYLRTTFDVNPDEVVLVQLGVQYDDGFIAYVNGVEVARGSMGAPGSAATFDTPAAQHEYNATPEWFTLQSSDLQEGTNVIALQVHNATLDSSDCNIFPQVRSYSSLCPSNMVCRPFSETNVRITWENPFDPAPYEAVEIYRNGELIGGPVNPASRFFTDPDVPSGEHTYEVVAIVDGVSCEGDDVPSCTVMIQGPDVSFRRGDADGDGTVNLTDAVAVLLELFRGGDPSLCRDAADVDDDGAVNLTDAVYILLALFRGGDAPPAPGLESCGPDPTDDELADCVYDAC